MSVGRGTTSTQDDLVTALSKNYIGGAVRDVFQQEPLPPINPLWSMDNVIITAHTASFSFSKQMSLLQNDDFRSTSRHVKNLTAGI